MKHNENQARRMETYTNIRPARYSSIVLNSFVESKEETSRAGHEIVVGIGSSVGEIGTDEQGMKRPLARSVAHRASFVFISPLSRFFVRDTVDLQSRGGLFVDRLNGARSLENRSFSRIVKVKEANPSCASQAISRWFRYFLVDSFRSRMAYIRGAFGRKGRKFLLDKNVRKCKQRKADMI